MGMASPSGRAAASPRRGPLNGMLPAGAGHVRAARQAAGEWAVASARLRTPAVAGVSPARRSEAMLAALLRRLLGTRPERLGPPNRCLRCGEPIHVAYMKAMTCGRCG